MQTQIANPLEHKSVTISSWLHGLDAQYRHYKSAGWDFIFLLRDGIDALSNTEGERTSLYEAVSEQIGLTVHTLRNYVSTSRKPYSALAQELALEIGHVDAVAGLTDEQAEDALNLAGEQLWSVAQLRGYVFPKKAHLVLPDVGNQPSTPYADAIDKDLASTTDAIPDDPDDAGPEPAFCDKLHYRDDPDDTLPPGYDFDSDTSVPWYQQPLIHIAATLLEHRNADIGELVSLLIGGDLA